MKKKYITLFFNILFLAPIINASEDPDEINTKTPNDASKIIPGLEEGAKQKPFPSNNSNYRLGRKRRHQSNSQKNRKLSIKKEKENI